MAEQPAGKIEEISAFVKPIFLKWEKLRLPYNLVLLLVTALSYGTMWHYERTIFAPVLLLILLIGAVLSNICFLAGPIAESYIAWLGLKSPVVTGILFIGGVLISIPCVMFFLPYAPMMHGF